MKRVCRTPLGGRLARSDVYAPDWTVILGRAGEEAVIGPDVAISCDRVLVAAASLRVDARTTDESVTLHARCIEHEAAEFHLTGADRERFRLVLSEQPGYRWTGFLSDDTAVRHGDEPAD